MIWMQMVECYVNQVHALSAPARVLDTGQIKKLLDTDFVQHC
jgi:hypothetical protein